MGRIYFLRLGNRKFDLNVFQGLNAFFFLKIVFFGDVFGFRIAADYLIDIMQTLVFIEPIFLEHRPFGSSLEDPTQRWLGRGSRQSNDWLRWPLLKAEMMYYPNENQDFWIHTDNTERTPFFRGKHGFEIRGCTWTKILFGTLFPHETSPEFHLCQQGASAGFLQHQH